MGCETTYLSWLISPLVLLPNVWFLVLQPTEVPPRTPMDTPPTYLALIEQVGRSCCFVLPFLYCVHRETFLENACLGLMACALGVYYWLWGRYLLGGRKFRLLFAPLGPVPVPLALSPVLYFLCASLVLHAPFLTAGAVVFGVGHGAISVREYQRVPKKGGS